MYGNVVGHSGGVVGMRYVDWSVRGRRGGPAGVIPQMSFGLVRHRSLSQAGSACVLRGRSATHMEALLLGVRTPVA